MFLLIFWLIIFIVLAYGFFKLDSNPLLAFYELFFPNKDRLKNKIIWIVGASTGIGEELAYQLAELNCKLILTSTTESKLEEVKKNCIKRSNNNLKPDDILVLSYDISDFHKNDEAFKQIIAKFSKIDILINNAARLMMDRTSEIDMEYHRKSFDINYFANIYITKLVIKYWLTTKSKGIIMPTSSIGAYINIPFYSTYTSSKAALQRFYTDLSLIHSKDGISIVIVAPGPIKTSLVENSFEINGKKAFSGDIPKLMKTSRCVELMIIAMANKLFISWIAEQPFLLFAYIFNYFDYQIICVLKKLNFIKYFEKRIKKDN